MALKGDYQEYLKSDEWRTRREWALKWAGHACQVCNGTSQLEVHHRTYANVGAELPGDLTVLCRDCHGLFHGKKADIPPRPRPARNQVFVKEYRREGAERQILQVMAQDGGKYVAAAARLVSAEHFQDPYNQAVFEALCEGLTVPPSKMDPVAAQRFDEITRHAGYLRPLEVFAKASNRLRVLALSRRVREVQRSIEAATDDAEKLGLMTAKSKLAAELRELDPTYWPADR